MKRREVILSLYNRLLAQSHWYRKERGVTLVEVLIVLAVIAILAVAVIPNVTGFLTISKERAYEADRRLLQAAVDSWRTDVKARAGNPIPTLDSKLGTPSASNNSYIDIGKLATDKYLSGSDAVKSADVTKNTTATNSPSGSYGWYLDNDFVVRSLPVFTAEIYP